MSASGCVCDLGVRPAAARGLSSCESAGPQLLWQPFRHSVYLHLHSKALNKMFAYNHKQSEWREMAAMKTPRSMFGAVIHNGKIVVAGGVNEEGLTASCEAYDFASNKYDRVHV